jgi:hypothetical protein
MVDYVFYVVFGYLLENKKIEILGKNGYLNHTTL